MSDVLYVAALLLSYYSTVLVGGTLLTDCLTDLVFRFNDHLMFALVPCGLGVA
jgi:hypothetical protein